MATDAPDWVSSAFLVPESIPVNMDFPDWVEAIEVVGGGPYTPNTPSTIPNQLFWHDASLITGVADGALLSAWPSITNPGTYSLSQNPPFQPTYYSTTVSKQIAGKPAVWFGGTQNMLVSPVPSSLGQPLTVYMVAGVTVTTGTQVLFDTDNGGSPFQVGTTGGGWYATAGSTINGPATTTGQHLFVMVANGVSSSFIIDGLTGTGNLGSNTFSPINPGCDTLSAHQMTGFICEMGGYSRVLNVAELAALHSYSQNKWATP